MKKTENKVSKKRTMATVLAELNDCCDKYNLSDDIVEKAQLTAQSKALTKEYNELSLLHTYSEFMKAEHPIVALAQSYYYEIVATKDTMHDEVIKDVITSSSTRSVNFGYKRLDVTKFIEWTQERNKCIAADKNWKSAMGNTRRAIEKEWKMFFENSADGYKISVNSIKKSVQELFDALVFVKSETGKNAIVATGNIAKWVIGFANTRKDSKVDNNLEIKGYVLTRSQWNILLLDILNQAVVNKSFDIVYGLEEEEKALAQKTEKKSATKKAEKSAK